MRALTTLVRDRLGPGENERISEVVHWFLRYVNQFEDLRIIQIPCRACFSDILVRSRVPTISRNVIGRTSGPLKECPRQNDRFFGHYGVGFLEPYYSGGSAKGCSYQLSGRDSLSPVSLSKLKPDHVR
jgi:hypothetical protein